MKLFHGSLEELKAGVAACQLTGEWTDKPQNGLHSFRARTGEILNWWPARGTVQFQGKNMLGFASQLEASLAGAPPQSVPARSGTARIFVVHGHDRDARDQLELVLRRLGLEPFIL